MSNDTTTHAEQRIAGAPISWGVCEVPGWGYQLGPDRVLKEMREVGLHATELGPEGFLPSEPTAMARSLSQHGLQAVGGFTPLLLHVPGHDPLPGVDRILDGYVASGAKVLVLSTDSGLRIRHSPGTRRRRVGHAAGEPGSGGPARRGPWRGQCCTPTWAR